MKKFFTVIALLAQLVVAGGALATIVNFSGVTSTTDITNPIGVTLNGVTFRYDNFGYSNDSAFVDSGGIYGTTGGNLILEFSYPATALSFDFTLYLTPSGTTPVGAVNAFFSNGDSFPAQPNDVGGLESGTFDYSGSPFNMVSLYFPVDEPNFSIFNVSYTPVPEPGTFALLAAGLFGISGLRFYRRRC